MLVELADCGIERFAGALAARGFDRAAEVVEVWTFLSARDLWLRAGRNVRHADLLGLVAAEHAVGGNPDGGEAADAENGDEAAHSGGSRTSARWRTGTRWPDALA